MELPKLIGKLKQLSLSIAAARLGLKVSGYGSSKRYEQNEDYPVVEEHLRLSLLSREERGQDRYQLSVRRRRASE